MHDTLKQILDAIEQWRRRAPLKAAVQAAIFCLIMIFAIGCGSTTPLAGLTDLACEALEEIQIQANRLLFGAESAHAVALKLVNQAEEDLANAIPGVQEALEKFANRLRNQLKRLKSILERAVIWLERVNTTKNRVCGEDDAQSEVEDDDWSEEQIRSALDQLEQELELELR